MGQMARNQLRGRDPASMLMCIYEELMGDEETNQIDVDLDDLDDDFLSTNGMERHDTELQGQVVFNGNNNVKRAVEYFEDDGREDALTSTSSGNSTQKESSPFTDFDESPSAPSREVTEVQRDDTSSPVQFLDSTLGGIGSPISQKEAQRALRANRARKKPSNVSMAEEAKLAARQRYSNASEYNETKKMRKEEDTDETDEVPTILPAPIVPVLRRDHSEEEPKSVRPPRYRKSREIEEPVIVEKRYEEADVETEEKEDIDAIFENYRKNSEPVDHKSHTPILTADEYKEPQKQVQQIPDKPASRPVDMPPPAPTKIAAQYDAVDEGIVCDSQAENFERVSQNTNENSTPRTMTFDVMLTKDPANGLGLTLVDGNLNGVPGVYVKLVADNGAGMKAVRVFNLRFI
ncbi:hypothetical protein CAEBREN_31089 [Caenorhabditis brenneri]|uniref:PDZ domain-containing protein n=1 Tax=Caenorhabditis brenneri TaxID=135651 RepID=G0PES1_CAEBE|nr:hypothetical protein CAEBREN_31089 [Caenorhabditis brenneri]